ncbi:MAG: Invasin, domain 3, partial [bacterium]
MATIHGLRHVDRRPTENGGRFSHVRAPKLLALLLIAVSVALVAAFLTGASRSSEPAPFVSRALGPHDPAFLLDRNWDGLTRIAIAGGGVRISHAGRSVAIASDDAGTASWSRHAWGVERPTAFGRESIVVAAPRTEEYLTVERRLGPKIWKWRLSTSRSVPQVELDGSISFRAAGVRTGIRVLPPVVYDRAGRDVTPAGAHWSIDHSQGRTYLALALDDRALALPYVIDPITIVGAPGQTGSTKTGSPLVITKPTGVATGNLMVATISLRDATATLTAPAGWTLLTSVATSGATTKQFVYTKVATAGEAASYSFSWAGGSGASDSSGVILAYSGIWAGAGSNIDTSTVATANATTTASTAAGTAAYAQDMILALYGTAGDSSFTTPTGMTIRGAVTSVSGAPAVRSSSGSFDVIQAASGTIAANSSTITSRDETAVMVAIRPAAATASAGLSTLTASPTTVTADGSTTSTLTATIKDTNGNPLPGKTVTLAKSGGSSTITTVSGTTDAAGVATFTVTDGTVESTTYTATDTT